MDIIKLNDRFSSLDELEERIKEYSRRNYVDLHKSDARTLGSALKAKKVKEDRVKKAELVYYEVNIFVMFTFLFITH